MELYVSGDEWGAVLIAESIKWLVALAHLPPAVITSVLFHIKQVMLGLRNGLWCTTVLVTYQFRVKPHCLLFYCHWCCCSIPRHGQYWQINILVQLCHSMWINSTSITAINSSFRFCLSHTNLRCTGKCAKLLPYHLTYGTPWVKVTADCGLHIPAMYEGCWGSTSMHQ